MRHQTALLRALVTLSTIVVGLVLLLPSAGEATAESTVTEIHVVQPGDTVWGIAAAATPSDGDVRDTVAVVMDMNELSSSLILPGTELVVPVARKG